MKKTKNQYGKGHLEKLIKIKSSLTEKYKDNLHKMYIVITTILFVGAVLT